MWQTPWGFIKAALFGEGQDDRPFVVATVGLASDDKPSGSGPSMHVMTDYERDFYAGSICTSVLLSNKPHKMERLYNVT